MTLERILLQTIKFDLQVSGVPRVPAPDPEMLAWLTGGAPLQLPAAVCQGAAGRQSKTTKNGPDGLDLCQ